MTCLFLENTYQSKEQIIPFWTIRVEKVNTYYTEHINPRNTFPFIPLDTPIQEEVEKKKINIL